MTGVNSTPTKPAGETPRSRRKKRKAISCEECRRSKLRCDRQQPCGACKRRGRDAACSFESQSTVGHVSTNSDRTPAHSRLSNAVITTVGSPSTPSTQTATSNPGVQPDVPSSGINQLPPDTHWEAVLERPTPGYDTHETLSLLSIGPRMALQEIIDSLPPKPCCDYLVSTFFKNISALFPILHGPTFLKQYTTFMQQPYDVDLAWLALLFSICSLVINTLDANDPRLVYIWPQSVSTPTQAPSTVSASHRLLRTAMTCLSQDHFFIRHKFSTFEALLMVIYNLSHNESVDQGWALLGMALNIGIALRCNVDQNLSPVETQRRRRCWAGLLTLHTYQGILFRDVDMTYLLNIKASLPADVNDYNITDEGISQPPNVDKPTQMSVMMAKVRIFQLSTQICSHISGPLKLDQRLLREFDTSIAEEQAKWDTTWMVDGSPNILETNSFAYWCVLQTYAHHLYLLLHRPFHHSKGPSFLPASRNKCIASSAALMSLHRQFYEAPLLRNYIWLLNGVTSLKALHAAVALNSCLQDIPSAADIGYDVESSRLELDKLVLRMEALSERSNICLKAHRILRHLQVQSGIGNHSTANSDVQIEQIFEDWTDIREWTDAGLVNWNMDGAFHIFTD
ncbi:hypothetical protein N7478_001926 [Penicillium angulare]|uniref:uncharacterized protein n=1 Tax=Penicillium angulare TaxID=116970 RepID=UPI0025422B9F|nr:uncharacterized protein N7478_001926 [Penicillium angulare]KAJ5288896.1 hypothetical protein N7478_001926 [Penicillium angulare]